MVWGRSASASVSSRPSWRPWLPPQPAPRRRPRLRSPAAGAFRQLSAAAERDGVRIGVNDSYRSYEQQVDVARRKGLYSQGGLAAKPGTSEHGWGLSLDLALDGRAQRWMRANGP